MIADGSAGASLELQRMAQMLQEMQLGHGNQQNEQDQRWENMVYEMEQLKEQGKEPTTGGEFQNIMIKHGLQPLKPLTGSAAKKTMKFDKFMNLCENRGWQLLQDYDAKHQPDAPRSCDGCKQRGARMRCYNCGETYCSVACQKKDWKDHREICVMAGRDDTCRKMPELLTWEDYDVRILRKGPSSSYRPSHSMPAASASGYYGREPGKNAKKNKKKREKAKADKAAAAPSGTGDAGSSVELKNDTLPAYADVD